MESIALYKHLGKLLLPELAELVIEYIQETKTAPEFYFVRFDTPRVLISFHVMLVIDGATNPTDAIRTIWKSPANLSKFSDDNSFWNNQGSRHASNFKHMVYSDLKEEDQVLICQEIHEMYNSFPDDFLEWTGDYGDMVRYGILDSSAMAQIALCLPLMEENIATYQHIS